MAASPSIQHIGPSSELVFAVVSVALDSSYPSGGYTLTAKQLGFSSTRFVIVTSHTGGNVYEFVPDAAGNGGKLKVYRQTTVAGALPEVTNGTSLAGVSVQLFASGV